MRIGVQLIMTHLLQAVILVFVSGVSLGVNINELQCRDENNEPVDWFVVYKLPKIRESSEPLIRSGIFTVYIASNSDGKKWTVSKNGINSKYSLIANTLAPLYDNKTSQFSLWTMYNDHPPNKPASATKGHSKGVVMAGNQRGFWLIHSVPNFPPIPKTGTDPPLRSQSSLKTSQVDETVNEKSSHTENDAAEIRGGANALGADNGSGDYSYPTSGINYGQSFLCISVGKNSLDTIGWQLMYNQIVPYRNNLPEVLAKEYPALVNASNKIRINGNGPQFSVAGFKSSANVEFTSLAKSDKWGKDLYDDLVAPKLESDFFVETWRNGRGKLPSECSGKKVVNVDSVILREANVDFTSTRDHSKWAVSATEKGGKNWVCIGDINRASTQFDRGGGTVCFNKIEVWRKYFEAVNDAEFCPKKKRSFPARIWDGFKKLFSY